MPETPHISYEDAKQDSNLAQVIAINEEPFRVGIDRAKEFGQTATIATLNDLQQQAHNIAKEDKDYQAWQAGQAKTSSTESETKGITEKDREIIQHWLDTGLVTMHTWLGPNNIDRRNNPDRQNRFLTVFSDRAKMSGAYSYDRTSTPDRLQALFTDKSIPELVTASKSNIKFEKVDRQSPKGQENLVMIQYEVLTRGYQNQYGVAARGRISSNITRLHLFLPESEAVEALQTIKGNPQVVRELADVFMGETLGAGESWEQARPSYDKLREINGGVNRMAFYEGNPLKASLENSQIVEF
ncbi:MAG TPA: hypothetical protein VH234_04025 [Candidatus Saccharimonadales bacterium]|jgi:hypothetical protein|nr:hypothetical protein [Candidatus Saccharimonadales bacterium]